MVAVPDVLAGDCEVGGGSMALPRLAARFRNIVPAEAVRFVDRGGFVWLPSLLLLPLLFVCDDPLVGEGGPDHRVAWYRD